MDAVSAATRGLGSQGGQGVGGGGGQRGQGVGAGRAWNSTETRRGKDGNRATVRPVTSAAGNKQTETRKTLTFT